MISENRKEKSFAVVRAAAVILVALFCLSLFHSGCKNDRGAEGEYILMKNGRAIGGETVRIEERDGEKIYSGYERRPYSNDAEKCYRSVRVSGLKMTLKEYFTFSEFLGVRRRSRLFLKEGSFYYFRDDLNTFFYMASGEAVGETLPFSLDSALMCRFVLDVWEARGHPHSLPVVIPERSSALRSIAIARSGRNRFKMSVSGICDYELTLGPNGNLISNMVDDKRRVEIEKGSFRPQQKSLVPKRGSLKEVEVTVVGGAKLSGYYFTPAVAPPYPVVVLAGDVGPYDRTGNGLFTDLVERLVADGFAVLALDRRGCSKSTGKPQYSLDLAVSDLSSEVDFLILRGDVDVERIYALGFGEGGLVAAKAAADNPYISGCVILGAPCGPLFPEYVSRRIRWARKAGELDATDESYRLGEIPWLEKVVKDVDANYVTADGSTAYLGWIRSFSGTSLEETAAFLEIPILLLYGGRDELAPPDDGRKVFEELKPEVRKASSFKVFNHLDHSFGRVFAEAEAAAAKEYVRLDRSVLNTITAWLKRLSSK